MRAMMGHAPTRLAPGIRLRQERFGGLVFDPRRGTTLEVDTPGFAALWRLRSGEAAVLDGAFAGRLLGLGILEEGEPRVQAVAPPLPAACRHPWLSAPETVHWAVTYRCGMDCPDCYAARLQPHGEELDTAGALKLVDRIAGWGVFQLALGGGEPLAREDIAELAHHAAAGGLVVHLTTGRWDVPDRQLLALSGGVRAMQFGVHADLFQTPRWTDYLRGLADMRHAAAAFGMITGANLCLSRSVQGNFDALADALLGVGFERLTLLRYKPPTTIRRWEEEAPEPEQLLALKPALDKLATRPGLGLRLDCALSFLQNGLPPEVAAAHGIVGCAAANRIAAVAPDGSLYPCSQLVDPNFRAGNLLAKPPDHLWHCAPALQRHRRFRKAGSFRRSPCGKCRASAACGGCRVFAHDARGGDPGCPEPLPKHSRYPGEFPDEWFEASYPKWLAPPDDEYDENDDIPF